MSFTHSFAATHISAWGKFLLKHSMAGRARTESPIQLGARTSIFIESILLLNQYIVKTQSMFLSPTRGEGQVVKKPFFNHLS
jgi:hypothetical protein